MKLKKIFQSLSAVVLLLVLPSCQGPLSDSPSAAPRGPVRVTVPSINPQVALALNLPLIRTPGSESRALLFSDKVELVLYRASALDKPLETWIFQDPHSPLGGGWEYSCEVEVPAGEDLVLEARIFNSYAPGENPRVTGRSAVFQASASAPIDLNILCFPQDPVVLSYGGDPVTGLVPTLVSGATGYLGSDLWYEVTPTDSSVFIEVTRAEPVASQLFFCIFDSLGKIVTTGQPGPTPLKLEVQAGKKLYLGILDYTAGSPDTPGDRSFSLRVGYFDKSAATLDSVTYAPLSPETSFTEKTGVTLGTGAGSGSVAMKKFGGVYVAAWTDNDRALNFLRVQEDGTVVTPQVKLSEQLNSSVGLFIEAGTLHLVTLLANGHLVHYSSSDGLNWGIPTVLELPNDVFSSSVRYAQTGSILHLVDMSGGSVVTVRVDLGANTFSPPVIVSNESATGGTDPSIAAWGDEVFVAFRRWGDLNGQSLLFSSTDGGATWDGGRVISPQLYAFDFAMDYDGTHLVLVSNNDTKLLVSSDRGESWTTKILKESHGAQALVWSGNHYFLAVGKPFSSPQGLDFVTISGADWSEQRSALPGKQFNFWGNCPTPALAVEGDKAAVLYVNGQGTVIFQSSADRGQTWLDRDITVEPAGARLQKDTPEVPVTGDSLAGVRDGSRMWLVHGNQRGSGSALSVLRSLDAGATWEAGVLGTSSQASQMSLGFGTSGLYLCWVNNGVTYLSKSTDQGENWETRYVDNASGNGDAGTKVAVLGDRVYVAYTAYSAGKSQLRLATSEDAGVTFSLQPLGGEASFGEPGLVARDDQVWIAIGGNLFRSENGGTTWATSTTGITSYSQELLLRTGGELQIVSGGQVYVSTDNGVTFSPQGPSVSSFDALDFSGLGLLDVQGVGGGGASGLNFLSLTGSTWNSTLLDSGYKNSSVVYLADAAGQDIRVFWKSAQDYGVMMNHSPDGGGQWTWSRK